MAPERSFMGFEYFEGEEMNEKDVYEG